MSRFLVKLFTHGKSAVCSSIADTKSCFNTKKIVKLSTSTKLFTSYPQVQKPAPHFSGTAVVNGEFKDIQLSDYRGNYIVLLFYPLDFTFVCPTELLAFSAKLKEFKALNSVVIGISTDSHFSHLAWMNTPKKQGGLGGDLGYPLLSDFNKKIAADYGILLADSGTALRGLFIIDKEGLLRQFSVNDLPVGRNVDETIRLIKAFQFFESHGEVCPADWQPDSKTIKPNPKDSKLYFESLN